MSTRQFCDRCDMDITGEHSGVVHGIEDADDEGNGSITESADLCSRCYEVFKMWLTTKKVGPAKS